jgi:Rad3-related DNA helicase
LGGYLKRINMEFRSTEQANFSKLVQAHIRQADGPLLLEGGTGLGKTRAYLHQLIDSGKRVSIVLPTHQLIHQLMVSDDMAACRGNASVSVFMPARSYDNRQDYLAHRDIAMSSQVMICTSASVIVDQRLAGEYNGVTTRDYILFDEADQLPSVAALQSDREVTPHELKELGIKVASAEETARTILATKSVPAEVRAAAKMIMEAIDDPAWYHTAGVTDDGGIALFHRLPGRLLKKIANRNNVAFVSATLSVGGKFSDFKGALGISKESVLSAMIEPEKHGEVVFHFDGSNPVDSEDWLEATRAVMLDAERPCLVITPSHNLAQQLGDGMPDATVRQSEETTFEAVQRMDNDLLVAAAAWAGLDTPVQWRSIIIPRIPFPAPTVLDDHIESSYINMRNEAIRRLRQGLGRGLRRPDAVCDLYLLDPRFKSVRGFVPQRFDQAWHERIQEGGRKEVTLSKIERSPYYRKVALKHYGCYCHACDFEPKADSQIHVHHLNPLAEGERTTTVDDLVPLCANCHALAHSEVPPIALEVLRHLSKP